MHECEIGNRFTGPDKLVHLIEAGEVVSGLGCQRIFRHGLFLLMLVRHIRGTSEGHKLDINVDDSRQSDDAGQPENNPSNIFYLGGNTCMVSIS